MNPCWGEVRPDMPSDTERDLFGPILDAMPASVFWKDCDSVFMGSNQRFADDAALSGPAEVVGKTDFDMVWREHAEKYQADDREVMASGIAKTHYEELHTTSDGRNVWVRTSKVPIRDAAGEVIGVLGTYVDITQERELAARLEEKGRLEAVGRLAGGVAHDFNNLLTAITGSVDLVEKQVPALGDVQPHLRLIRQATRRAAELTGRLLAFARREVVVPQAIDLTVELPESADLLRSLMGAGVELRYDFASRLWPITIDQSQFQRVLVNLAANARDAMPTGGRVTIQARNVHLDAAVALMRPDVVPGEYVEIAFSDNGQGMSSIDRLRLFEPFFTTKEHGSGLGMSISHGLVKQSGGHIWVYSELGQGTTFKLYFPRSEDAAPATEVPSSRRFTRTGTVLFVEDDSVIRRITTAGLLQRGYVVHAAASLAQATKVVESMHAAGDAIDILVCDVMLQDARGPEVAEMLRRYDPDCAVLYASGYTANTVLDDGLLSSDVNFLSKPYSLNELVAAVSQLLEHRAMSSSVDA